MEHVGESGCRNYRIHLGSVSCMPFGVHCLNSACTYTETDRYIATNGLKCVNDSILASLFVFT